MNKNNAALLALAYTLIAAFAPAQTMPSFNARRDYPGLFTQIVAVGDTNGDGIPDLIASDEGVVSVLFGNGDGTFRSGPTDNRLGLNGAAQLAPSDLNGDGKVDLVFVAAVSDSSAGGVLVCLGNGDGTFQKGSFYPAGTDAANSIGDLVVGDFNGDGTLDVAQVGSSGVWLFLGRGDGTLASGVVVSALEPGGRPIAAADFNSDGKLDLVVGISFAGGEQDQGDGFYLLLGNGNGTFQTPQHFTQPERPGAIAAGALGVSGNAGIVVTGFSSPIVSLYFGNGQGGFGAPTYVDLPSAGNLELGDVNADGIPDLVFAGEYAYVAYGTPAGTFEKPVEFPIQAGQEVYNVALADLRNDGRTDIITDSQFGISVLLNQTEGRFEDGVWTKLGVAAGCGVSGDFNGDGKPDLAVNTSTGISILLGTGKASSPFTVGESIPLAGAGCLTQARDINGDGILDLVITSPGEVNAYLGNGDGTFTFKSSTPISNAAEYVVLADFNRDGKLDFATNGNALALGNGDGTFQNPEPFVSDPPSGGFDNITVGDINNDGWEDVVLTNFDLPYANLYVGLNNHKGGFTSIAQSFGADTTGAVLADLNGDGFLDLVCTNNVYLGNGKGNFTFLMDLGFEGAGGTFDMVADLNGDGIPDIAVLGSGTVQIYLGMGNATYATPFYLGTGPSPGMILPANLHGQKAKAGLPDLVAPDESGGVMVLANTTP